jgi:hypothetical protein
MTVEMWPVGLDRHFLVFKFWNNISGAKFRLFVAIWTGRRVNIWGRLYN